MPSLNSNQRPHFLVARHDLGGEIALLEPLAERLVPPALELQHQRQAEQDERELDGREIMASSK